MNKFVKEILDGSYENHIFPFFWQHGEDEKTLREYMKVIDEANCHAVCIESRPHPDFCGKKWWEDMDIILDEARKRNMKVWILDDSHFPTGFANGAMKNLPESLHRQSICASVVQYDEEPQEIKLDVDAMIPPEFTPANLIEQYTYSSMIQNAPRFEDDRVISIIAVNCGTQEVECFAVPERGEKFSWKKPYGAYKLWIIGLSRNCGPHREYINMLDAKSCRVLIDAVYEPHYLHYKKDFGTTIAGFFSDEPELGNGHMYSFDNVLGSNQDLPFSNPLEEALERRIGLNWKNEIYLLWDNEGDMKRTAEIRYTYMDEVTKLVRENFSRQVGDWCREHGVQYIGHIIEDGNAHARTGSGLGHYFRGLDGQDMAGIDDIGGQVLPQGEIEPRQTMLGVRDGEFYHYQLGNLAASAAAISPRKAGNSMCEIFGNYGWEEGPALEKYLADHFMVRGINNFVPHAFSPAEFPDKDCPPHFYANGHNPQYKHFGKIVEYMNRVTTLISGGHRDVSVAVLYHGEAEWMGQAMFTQKVGKILYENQIDFDTIPADVFIEKEDYHTVLANPLRVNTQEYSALIIPTAEYITAEMAKTIGELTKKGLKVFIVDCIPKGIVGGEQALLKELDGAYVIPIKEISAKMKELSLQTVSVYPETTYLRVMHYKGKAELFYFVNESASTYEGTVHFESNTQGYLYDPWKNKIFEASVKDNSFQISLASSQSLMFILGEADTSLYEKRIIPKGERMCLREWKRSICSGISYPMFIYEKEVILPDVVSDEKPEFSGFIKYETSIVADSSKSYILTICGDSAVEAVEVFVNGKTAGIEVVKPMIYDISQYIVDGNNQIVIELGTTLERQTYCFLKDDPMMQLRGNKIPDNPTGLTGNVDLYVYENEVGE